MKSPAISALFSFFLFALLVTTSCTDNSTAKKAQQLEEQNKTLLAQIEEEQKQRHALQQSVAELRQQMEQAQQAAKQTSKQQTGEKWNALIDQILVKLERVKDEEQSFSTARLKTELSSEETRLKGIARDQETQARSLVYELKAQKFPESEQLDMLVKGFISDYTFFISYRRMSWEFRENAAGSINEKERKFQSDYYDKLSKISELKHRW